MTTNTSPTSPRLKLSEWLKLSDKNKLISALVIAICTIWGVREHNLSKQIDELNTTIKEKNKENSILSAKVSDCEHNWAIRNDKNNQQIIENLSNENKRKDSINLILTNSIIKAEKTIKNVQKN